MSGPAIVVTGAAGLVGGVVLAGLDPRHHVRGVDQRKHAPIAGRTITRANLTSASAARRALEGADVIIHLADAASQSTPWRTVHENNLRAAWNTFDAAREVGARRVIFASSNAVVGGYERDEPYRSILAGQRDGLDPNVLPRLGVDVPVRPNGAYAIGKVASETIGRHVADEFGMSVAALRIGTVLHGDRPENERHFATLLSHRDLVQLVERCIDAPHDPGFTVHYGVSANTWRIWDIEPTRSAIGYQPLDDAERWRHER
ncbi:MAG: NAD-dependent epimerase/dehydratase family protein [Microthrixaceae bacterium]